MLDLDLVERHVELFGDECGERRRNALPHLGARRDDGDGVVGRDLHIRVERRLALGEVALQRIGIRLVDVPVADGDAARDGGRADQEGAARDLSPAGHDQIPAVLSAAAFLMAVRMRG